MQLKRSNKKLWCTITTAPNTNKNKSNSAERILTDPVALINNINTYFVNKKVKHNN